MNRSINPLILFPMKLSILKCCPLSTASVLESFHGASISICNFFYISIEIKWCRQENLDNSIKLYKSVFFLLFFRYKVQVPLEASMGRLIVYCISTHYKPHEITSGNNPVTPNCCEMHSFSEHQATNLIEKHPSGIMAIDDVTFIY